MVYNSFRSYRQEDYEDKLKFNLGFGYVNQLNILLIKAMAYAIDGDMIKLCNCLLNLKKGLSCLMKKDNDIEVINKKEMKKISQKEFHNRRGEVARQLRGKYLGAYNKIKEGSNSFDLNGTNIFYVTQKDFNDAFYKFETFLYQWEEELRDIMNEHKLINPPKESGYGELDESD